MRPILITIIIVVIFSLRPVLAKKEKEYIQSVMLNDTLAAERMKFAKDVLQIAFAGGYSPQIDYYELMLTPSFKQRKLDEANSKMEEKISGINQKIQEAESGSKDTSELKKQLEKLKSQLYRNPSWMGNDELVSFVYVKPHKGLAKTVTNFKITGDNAEDVTCEALQREDVLIGKEGASFLKKVYGIGFFGNALPVYSVSYDPKCLLKVSASKYIVTAYNKVFKKEINSLFTLEKESKLVIKRDFGL